MLGIFIVSNHKQDLQPQKPKKTVEFPSDNGTHYFGLFQIFAKNPLSLVKHVQKMRYNCCYRLLVNNNQRGLRDV